MLEKIDNFINKFLNWKIFKNILLSQLFCVPHALIIGKYNIPMIATLVLNLSFLLSVTYFEKAFKLFLGKEE